MRGATIAFTRQAGLFTSPSLSENCQGGIDQTR